MNLCKPLWYALTALCISGPALADPDTLLYPLKDDSLLQQWDRFYYSRWTLTDSLEFSEPAAFETLSQEEYAKGMEKLDAQSPIEFVMNRSIKNYIESYLIRRPKQVTKLLAWGNYYFPLFEAALDRYGLPMELKYLPVIESALNPRAKSPVGAAGLWQFMYGTGKVYGLEVSSYTDDRMDPYLATDAACRHLKDLYDTYGDWNLVLAAYNAGPGNVRRAVSRSGGKTNYWQIRPFLPIETQNYVPAFMAACYVMTYAPEYGFQGPNLAPHWTTVDTVHCKRQIRFSQLQQVLEIPEEQLQVLNPRYKEGIVPAWSKGNPSALVLPREKAGIFIAKEDSIYAMVAADEAANAYETPPYLEVDQRIRYRVKPGDYLGKIAEKYGCRVSDIRRWNGMKSDAIREGQRLTLYVKPAYL